MEWHISLLFVKLIIKFPGECSGARKMLLRCLFFSCFIINRSPQEMGTPLKVRAPLKLTLQPLAVIPVKAGIHENQLYGFPDRVVE